MILFFYWINHEKLPLSLMLVGGGKLELVKLDISIAVWFTTLEEVGNSEYLTGPCVIILVKREISIETIMVYWGSSPLYIGKDNGYPNHELNFKWTSDDAFINIFRFNENVFVLRALIIDIEHIIWTISYGT